MKKRDIWSGLFEMLSRPNALDAGGAQQTFSDQVEGMGDVHMKQKVIGFMADIKAAHRSEDKEWLANLSSEIDTFMEQNFQTKY